MAQEALTADDFLTSSMPDIEAFAVECRDYGQLIAALVQRLTMLRMTFEALDEVAGLPARYSQKMLGADGIKSLGPISTGPTVGGLGVKLMVVHDAEAFAKIRKRLVDYKCAGTSMLAQGKRKRRRFLPFRNDPELARALRQLQLLKQPRATRRRIARNAALTLHERRRRAKSASAP